jgi:two-component system response regulator HydG
VVLCRGEEIKEEHLPAVVTGGSADRAIHREAIPTLNLEELEKIAIIKALKETNQNKSEAAVTLGISRRTLHRKLKEYGIS